MNLNKLAKRIAKAEAGMEEVNIAQIKEILRITLEELAHMESWEVLKLLDRYSYLRY